jgi:hypothetical protein
VKTGPIADDVLPAGLPEQWRLSKQKMKRVSEARFRHRLDLVYGSECCISKCDIRRYFRPHICARSGSAGVTLRRMDSCCVLTSTRSLMLATSRRPADKEGSHFARGQDMSRLRAIASKAKGEATACVCSQRAELNGSTRTLEGFYEGLAQRVPAAD